MADGYTKGDVNRAGRFFARVWEATEAGQPISLPTDIEIATIRKHSAAVGWWRAEHARPLAKVNANLRYYLPAKSKPTQRLKRRPTIFDKLCREKTMQLTQMADIGGARAIVPTQDEITAISRTLKKNWKVVRTRDYVTAPKDSGYRAVHHIVRRDGRLIEVQLRTPLQDLWANTVESDSRRLDVGLKSGVGPKVVHDYYVAVSAFFALRESASAPDEEFMRDLRERFAAATHFLTDPGDKSQ